MNTVDKKLRVVSSATPTQIKVSSDSGSIRDRFFEPLITAVEAASLLTIHPVTLLRWAREGRIPHVRLGRRVTFRTSVLELWLVSNYSMVTTHAA